MELLDEAQFYKLDVNKYGIIYADGCLHLESFERYFDLETLYYSCLNEFIRDGGDLESLST